MVFFGVFERLLFQDERTGESVFTISAQADLPVNDYGNVVCRGVIQRFPKHTPLEIEGELITDDQPYVAVAKCAAKSGSEAAAIMFLTETRFEQIGPATSAEIVRRFGADIFGFVGREDAVKELCTIRGITKKTALQFVSRLKALRIEQELLEYITSYGGTFEDARYIFDKYGLDSITQIEKNPYILRYLSVPYTVCESIAKEKGIGQFDPRRIAALLDECFRQNTGRGNTCMTFATLIRIADRIERDSNSGWQTNPFFLGAELVKGLGTRYKARKEGDVHYFYTDEMEQLERRAAEQTTRLLNSGQPCPDDPARIKEIEDMRGIAYAPEQKEAFRLLQKGGVALLTGGPGTGKSTVIDGLILYYEKAFPKADVALCAPTANAAKRLRETTGRNAQTIHKLLDIRPYSDTEYESKDEYDQLHHGLIIVDEASMIDIKLFHMLLCAVKNGALLILSGDEDQLRSVGPGNVLHDLLSNDRIPKCRLTKVFRQDEQSEIVQNSQRIRQGDTSFVEAFARDRKHHDRYFIGRVHTEEELERASISMMKRLYDPSDPQKTRLFTPVRKQKYIYSTVNLNRILQGIYNSGPKEDTLTYGGTTFAKGDPVIFIRNNYQSGYINGDEGVVKAIVDGDTRHRSLLVEVDGETIAVTGKDIDDLDLAYTLTTHKAQGSECETAVIVVPEQPKSMLCRSMIYVAATRAKTRNVFLVQNYALEEAIRNERQEIRVTGLNACIESCLAKHVRQKKGP